MRAAALLAAAAAPAAGLAPPGKLPGSAVDLTISAGTFKYTLTPAADSCGAGPHPLVTFWHARLMSGAAVGGYAPLIKSLQAECYTVLTCMDRANVKGPDTAPWVLESIDALKKKGDKRTDFTRVGVAGHSMGGGATVSALDKTDGSHHIKCGVGMHPWMQVAPGGAANVKIPLLFTTGSTDVLVPPPEVKKAYGQARGAKAFAEEKGAGHMEPLSTGDLNPWVVAMMNCHLQGKEADCDKVYKKSGWGDVKLSAYESVPPSAPPAPPAPPRYHCDAATGACSEAAEGHSTIAKCQAACAPAPAPTPPAPPASSVYACVVSAGVRTCQQEPEGFPGAYPSLAECQAQCPSRLRAGDTCYACVMPATGCEATACSVPGTYPSKSACASACPVAPAPPAPAPPAPATRYHCDPTTYACAAGAEGHSTLAKCQSSCAAPAPPAPGSAAGPGSGPWEVATPASVGLEKSRLEAADKYVAAHASKRDCFVVIKDGKLVYESYTPSSYNTSSHDGFSMTKTLGALIVLRAATQGKLDIDADITQTYGVKSPKSYPVTARQIMTQSLAGGKGPGQEFAYDALGTKWIDHLPNVVKAATGQPASHTLAEFETVLGLSPAFKWTNVNTLWSGESFGTCRDYARYGQLILNKGAWRGHGQFVSADLVEQLGTPQKFGKYSWSNPCYGLLTWLNTDPAKYPGKCKHAFPNIIPNSPFIKNAPTDLKMALGLDGEVTLVMPSQNAVVVSMGKTPAPREVVTDVYAGVCTVFGLKC